VKRLPNLPRVTAELTQKPGVSFSLV